MTGKKVICETCGKPFIQNGNRQKYCKKCSPIIRKIRYIGEEEKAKALMALRYGIDYKKYEGKETECRVKGSCYYGAKDACMYCFLEGRSRLLAGYPIKDGKCDAYKRKTRARKGQPRIPVSPVMSPGKLGEV